MTLYKLTTFNSILDILDSGRVEGWVEVIVTFNSILDIHLIQVLSNTSYASYCLFQFYFRYSRKSFQAITTTYLDTFNSILDILDIRT